MNLNEIIKNIELEVVAGNNGLDKEANGVYIGDLLSLVMSKANANNIWITIQTHVNIIAVSNLVELSAIIVVEDMEIDNETIVKANSLDLPVLKTSLSAYELACKLNKLGV